MITVNKVLGFSIGFGALERAFLLFAVPFWAGACGADSRTEGSECTPGRSVSCSGAQGCDGRQVCNDAGTAFGACDCSGEGPFPATGPRSGLVGATCQSDGDCRDGYACLPVDGDSLAGEAPSAGLCTRDCARERDGCESLDPDSTCVELDDRGTASTTDDVALCLPRCVLGPAEVEDDKCRGRVDLVCTEATAGTGVGYCRPACRSDVDCAGRHCNLRTGLCGDEVPSGDPIGSACTTQNSTCAGGCIEHGSSYAECSGVCSLGTPGCGQATSGGPPYDYFCYLDPAGAAGAGDLGYCTATCDCDDDCGRSDAVCTPVAELTESSGREGVCASRLFASGGARPNLPCP